MRLVETLCVWGSVVACGVAVACGGQVGVDSGPDGAGAPGSETGGSGGTDDPDDPDDPGSGGASGGQPPFVEPECPDEPPPPPVEYCDPLDPLTGCEDGSGCYAFIEYPYGRECGFPQYGAYCAPRGTGEQGELCGEGNDYCAPGNLCVVGAAGGARCGKICLPHGDVDCPPGLICGETDIAGYGVCY